MTKRGFADFARGASTEREARQRLLQLLKETPIPDDELLVNLGLYTRSLILAKILYLNELYTRIIDIPGVIMEFGVWWGSTLSLLASLRSVYEPYNATRKVIGFDTWEGYQSFSAKDGQSEHVTYTQQGGYRVSRDYEQYLEDVLDAHEADNVLPQIKKHVLAKGNVLATIDAYLRDNPETIIALSYFDLGLYEPTKRCLEAIRPHLVRGSVIAMDELNSRDFPGETVALRETLGLDRYRILRSRFLPDRSYIIID